MRWRAWSRRSARGSSMTRCTPPMSKPKNSRQNLRCCRPDGTRLARSVAVLEQRQRVLTSRRRQAVHLLDEIAAAGRPGARDLLALLWIDHVVILDKQRLRTGPRTASTIALSAVIA